MASTAPPIFSLRPPVGVAVPLVVSIPHAGTYVPREIARSFAGDHIRALPMTDWHLHALYDFLPALGVTTLCANFSRFVVDLNRPPDASPLYPGRFETGLIATRTFQGEDIFVEPPDPATIEDRRRRYHAPYHQKLSELLEEKRRRFGAVLLIDAHSVASQASLLHPALQDDIYLGNRDGETCPDWVTEVIEQGFRGAKLKVVRNRPYKGGYITKHYGQLPGVQALQIEMCERLYMDESRPAVVPAGAQFIEMQSTLRSVFKALIRALDEYGRLPRG